MTQSVTIRQQTKKKIYTKTFLEGPTLRNWSIAQRNVLFDIDSNEWLVAVCMSVFMIAYSGVRSTSSCETVDVSCPTCRWSSPWLSLKCLHCFAICDSPVANSCEQHIVMGYVIRVSVLGWSYRLTHPVYPGILLIECDQSRASTPASEAQREPVKRVWILCTNRGALAESFIRGRAEAFALWRWTLRDVLRNAEIYSQFVTQNCPCVWYPLIKRWHLKLRGPVKWVGGIALYPCLLNIPLTIR